MLGQNGSLTATFMGPNLDRREACLQNIVYQTTVEAQPMEESRSEEVFSTPPPAVQNDVHRACFTTRSEMVVLRGQESRTP